MTGKCLVQWVRVVSGVESCEKLNVMFCGVQVIAFLYVVSTVTSWFNFLTCVWIGKLALPITFCSTSEVFNSIHLFRAMSVF